MVLARRGVVLLCLVAVGGCSAGVQVMRRDQTGGEIAVWGPVVPAGEQARHAIVEHCAGRFTVGAGAEDLGLGASHTALVPASDGDIANVPADARVLAYRCVQPASLRPRNGMAFLRGGFER